MSKRREFLMQASAICGMLASSANAGAGELDGSDVLKARPESWPIPKIVAGVKIPDSKLATEATGFVRGLSAPVVFNHVMRAYLFGELLGRAKGLKYDAELLYLGAVFHDLGQTEKFMGNQRFEVDGADAASAFLAARGMPKNLIEVVWDAVALHTSPGIVDRKRPEIALVSAGAGIDVGVRGNHLNKKDVDQIVQAFPRRSFKKEYQRVLAEIVSRKPQTAYGNFMSDIGKRHVPGFEAPNICDIIEAASFDE